MKKLKVALVIPTHFDIHSSLGNLLKVYRYLMKSRGIEVTIFTDRRNDADYPGFRIEKIRGICCNAVFGKILLVLGMPRHYYADLIGKLKGYDVIESSNPEFYWFAYQSYVSAKKYNSRLVYRTSQTVEGFYLFRLAKYLVIPFARKAYDYASFLLFANPQAEERCLRLGLMKNKSKSIVIGHATDTKCFRPMKVKKSKRKILLSVGGLYKIKGHHLIIKALKKIIEKGYDAELWIVGGGYYKSNLIELAKSLGIADRVKFLGKKSHADLANIYNRSHVFVLANYQEITPAVNEAMACSIPVVAMNCGGDRFAIPSDDFGFIAKKFDVGDIADKILFLLGNRDKARKLGLRGREFITKNFSIEKVGLKMYKAFIG